MKTKLQTLKTVALLLFLAIAGVSIGNAQIVTFNNSWSGAPASVNATAKDANLSTVTLSRGAGITSSSSSAGFRGTGFASGTTLTPANNDYFTFTLNAASGYTINLNSAVLTISLGSSATGPQSFGIYSSVGGYAVANQIGANLTATNSQSRTFPATGYSGLTSVEIRIYGWNASAGTGTGGPSAISLTGSVSLANSAPTAGSVNISGTPEVGETLSVTYTYTDSDSDPEGSSVYRWFRADNAAGANELVIGGANAQTYILTTADVNKYIRFGVQPYATSGTSPGTETFSAFTGPVTTGADALSTITADGTFTADSNVNYASYQGTDVLPTSHAFGRFSINDISGTPDDGLATTVTGITFSLAGSSNLESVGLYDALNNEIQQVTAGPTVTFTNLSLSAASGSSTLFTIRATFKPVVIDNAQPQFIVSTTTVDINGSFFATPSGGGASSPITGDQNRIEVTASQLAFIQQPVSTVVNGNQTITVGAYDANLNLDLDFNGLVTLTSNGFLAVPQVENANAGIAVFDDVNHIEADPAVILVAASPGLTPASSVEFSVIVPPAGLLLAEENFLYTGTLNANGYSVLSNPGVNVLTTSSGNLNLANYGSTGIGRMVTLATSGEDVSKTFAIQSGPTTVYASLLVSVTTATSTGDYFFALAPSAAATSYRGRLYVRSTTPGFVNFGIANAGAPIVYGNTNYPVAILHNLVVKYQITASNVTASVFVNPNLYSEPAVAETTVTDATNIPADLASYTIRQGAAATAAALSIDGIRIATNWGTALGNPQYDADANINAGNYNSVSILDGIIIANGNIGVNSSLTVENGTLNMIDKIITPAAAAVITIDGAIATANPNGLVGSATTTVSSANPHTFNADGTVIYNADVAQQISAMEYGTLELQGMGDKSFLGDTAVTGNLIHNNGGDSTLPSGFDLVVDGQFISTGAGEFIISNDANLIQSGAVNTNVGPITVKRDAFMKRLDYVYWSSPVFGQQLQDFSPMTLSNRFYELDEATNAFAQVDAESDFTAAKGYSLRAPNDYLEAPAAPQIFEGSFTGVPNNGEYTIMVTNTPTAGLGFNLIGNPYPSAVDAQEFLDGNAHIGTLYFWAHQNYEGGGVNYASFNGTGEVSAAGGEAPNGIIQTGQGFMVYAASSANAVFTNDMRSGDNSGQFFRAAPLEKHRIWLNLSTAGTRINQTLIGYIQNATNTHDIQYDGIQIQQESTRLSSLAGNTEYAIQGRALPFSNADVLPLAFTATTPGDYTISIDHVDGLFSDSQEIFVRDNMMGTVHNLEEAYTFASAAGTFNNRFEVVFQNTTLGIDNPSIENDNVVVYKNNGQLHVNTGTNLMDTVKVYDARGRLVYESNAINAANTSFSVPATQQLLVIQVTANGKTVNKKVIF